jgi:hypothetical protein
MSETKQKKRFFAKHAKSSAAVISLGIHAILILMALSFVAVTVIQKDEQKFEYKKVARPKKPLKKLKVPVKVNKRKPKPKLRKRVVAKNVRRNMPQIQMPEITGVKGGLGAMGDGGGVQSLGFTLPEIDFFGAKAKGEKVVFVVHFGPATIGDTPFKRMTGYTIRKRLEDMVNNLPTYTLFNVFAYYASDTDAISPDIMMATAENKQKVMDWMEPVNPLEGDYGHCFSWGNSGKEISAAKNSWPTKVENLPFYSMKWAYPYVVPSDIAAKYLPEGKGYKHWGRGVAGAILTQKPDTIFVLTTNYIDGWGGGNSGEPSKMMASYKKMFLDVYGPDKKTWPTINVVVLARAGRDSQGAYKVLNEQFGPIWKGTRGEGSVIEDITKYMTDDEKDLMEQYRAEYGAE